MQEMWIRQNCFQACHLKPLPETTATGLPGHRLTERSCLSCWPFPRHLAWMKREFWTIPWNKPDTSRKPPKTGRWGVFWVFDLWIGKISTATEKNHSLPRVARQPATWRCQNWWPWSLWWQQGAAGDLCTLLRWYLDDMWTEKMMISTRCWWYLDRENGDLWMIMR